MSAVPSIAIIPPPNTRLSRRQTERGCIYRHSGLLYLALYDITDNDRRSFVCLDNSSMWNAVPLEDAEFELVGELKVG